MTGRLQPVAVDVNHATRLGSDQCGIDGLGGQQLRGLLLGYGLRFRLVCGLGGFIGDGLDSLVSHRLMRGLVTRFVLLLVLARRLDGVRRFHFPQCGFHGLEVLFHFRVR